MHYFATVLLKNGLRAYGTQPQIWLENGKDCGCHQWVREVKKGTTGGECKLEGAGRAMTEARYTPDTEHAFCLNCNAWKGELGLEPTFQLYIEHLLMIFDEIKRVLKKTGTCFVNLGDSYSGSGKGIGTDRSKCKEVYSDDDIVKTNWKNIGIPAKSLLQIPSRFAIGMTDSNYVLRDDLTEEERNYVITELMKRGVI